MQSEKRISTLGILGGLGPMATVYFYELITAHTLATCDQDHIDIVISSKATTPDRTAFVLGKSEENPLDVMKAEARKLVEFGAELISVPCNTAHYFYDELSESVPVPVVNIIFETVSYVKSAGAGKIGVLATEGTVKSGAYAHMCEKLGVGYEVPSEEDQAALSEIIYSQIKQGKPADLDEFKRIAKTLTDKGCDKLILGCTELSVIAKGNKLDDVFVDSLDVLALRTIRLCGKTPIGFSDEMMRNII